MPNLQASVKRLRELAERQADILSGDGPPGTRTSDAFFDAVADFAEAVEERLAHVPTAREIALEAQRAQGKPDGPV